ncbi:AIPR family protein [Kitasatospora sp. CB02891]|uniref:AIPR family protein n=1 Tax=Kitasatospora sp. CB02891 TaxID=2020329 RepID=UPI0012FDC0E6|nr:AIPR family protein [Kitasatospora sp. CB02891]
MSGAQTLITTVYEQWKEQNASHMADSDAWEVFLSWLLLREKEVTLDAISDGIVDGSNDGGVDAIFTLLEGSVLPLDHQVVESPQAVKELPEGLELTLFVIQSKFSKSFAQTTISALQSVLPSALDLGADLDSLSDELNEQVREKLFVFRSAYKHLLAKRPKVQVNVIVGTRGLSTEINANVSSRVGRLREEIFHKLPSADVNVTMLGAEELWRMYDTREAETLTLECDEVLTSGESYVALARLSSFIKLISDEGLGLRRHLFDANVRDYQGQVAVNKEILASLRDSAGPDFWWLNNGVTIVCDEAHSVGKTFALKNIQIVNGLQTSHTLHNWIKEAGAAGKAALELDDRKILVRVIKASDDAVRDKIIRATNRQTPVPDASLRATDEIQRRIEAYFGAKGLFYDRRKGYYRNLGKDPAKIISIPYLGQAMYAIAYGRPEVARGKPNSLLAEDARYRQAFDPKAGPNIFYWAASVLRQVDEYLQSSRSQTRYSERRHLAPFVAFALVMKVLDKDPSHWGDIAKMAEAHRTFSDNELEDASTTVKEQLDKYTQGSRISKSDATKRQPFTKHLVSVILAPSKLF